MCMNKKLRKILNYYGIKKQLNHFQSEVFELNEAIFDASKQSATEMFADVCYTIRKTFADVLHLELNGYKDTKREHIKEEIADVMVMLKQFQLYYNISTDEIKEVMKDRVAKQLEIIAKEDKSSDK